jgi:hypothetical protein
MPSCARHVFPNSVVDLRLSQNFKINISNNQFLGAIPQDFDRAFEWYSHLRQPKICIRRPARICKHDSAAILKAPCCDQTVEKQSLVIRVQLRSKPTRLIQSPTSRHDHNVSAVSSQLPERFGKGKVPTGEQTDSSDGCIDRDMLVLPARLMCSLGVPEILLPVGAENATVV